MTLKISTDISKTNDVLLNSETQNQNNLNQKINSIVQEILENNSFDIEKLITNHFNFSDDIVKCQILSNLLKIDSEHVNKITKINIINERFRYEIAQEFCKSNNTCLNLQNFNLSEEHQLIIAQEQINNQTNSFRITNFNLSEEGRYKLALKVSNKVGVQKFLWTIHNYDLSEKYRMLLADKLLEQDPYFFSEQIGNFDLPHEKIKEIADKLLKTNPEALSTNLHNFFPNNNIKEKEYFQDQLILLSPFFNPWKEPKEMSLNELKKLRKIFLKQPHLICELPINLSRHFCADLLINGMVYQSSLLNQKEDFSKLLSRFSSQINKEKEQNIKKQFDHSIFIVISFLIYFMDIPNNDKDNLIEKFNANHSIFKDHRKLISLLHLLLELIIQHTLSTEQRKNILLHLFEEKLNPSNLNKKIYLLHSLFKMNKHEIIVVKKELSLKEIENYCIQDLFFKELQIEKTEELLEKFKKNIFDKFDNPLSVYIYLSKIKQLPEDEQKLMIPVYKEIILSIIQDTYDNFRYSRDPHFKKLADEFKVKKEILNKWTFSSKKTKLTIKNSSTEIIPKNERLKIFLKDRLIQAHHIKNLETEYPILSEFLKSDTPVDKYISLLNTQLQTKPEPSFEMELLLFCKDENHDLTELKKIVDSNRGFDIFKLDLNEFIGSSSPKNNFLYTKFYIEMTNDFSNILELGRQTGGCQNIDGSPNFNKCLLGYVFGKNRILAIKNSKNEKMIARCIVRLLWDETDKKPVMFMEKIYSLNPATQHIQYFLDFAKTIAKDQGLILLLSKHFNDVSSKKNNDYPNELVSYGSYAPFEYSDSNSDGITEGKYKCKGLYPPKETDN